MQAGYLNPAIQNAQQTVEKAIKALLIEGEVVFPRTHRIRVLKGLLEGQDRVVDITVQECSAFDAVYMDSRYPTESALPDFIPDRDMAQSFLTVAARVLASARKQIEES